MPLPLLALAAPAIVKGIGSFLGNKSKANAEKAQRELDNKYIQSQDAAKKGIMDKLTAAGFNPYGPQTTTSNSAGTYGSNTNTRNVTDVNQLTGTEIMGPYQGMEGKLRSLVEGRLGKGSPVTDGEIATQLKNINRSNAAAEAAVKNVIGSRGLGKAQAGSALTPMQLARTSQITDFLGTIPEVERQRNMQNEQQAQGLISAFGTGQRTTGRTTSVGSSNTSGFSNNQGSQTSGPDIQSLMALTMPSGPMQTNKTGYSAFGSALSGAGDLAGNLMAQYGGRTPAASAGTAGLPWTPNNGANFATAPISNPFLRRP